MTDLEITRLCAKAMELNWRDSKIGPPWNRQPCIFSGDYFEGPYDPLHDDAQAMALLNKFRLSVLPDWEKDNHWLVFFANGEESIHTDFRRAIVECVAKMQAAKP